MPRCAWPDWGLIAKYSDRRAALAASPLAVGTQKQVARSSAPEERCPALPAVFGSIVCEVATLAERCEIALVVVAGVVIEVRAGEH